MSIIHINPAAYEFNISMSGDVILTFHPDGTMTVGEKWRDCPDEAAQAILAAMGQQYGEVMELRRKVGDLEYMLAQDAAPQPIPEGFVSLSDFLAAIDPEPAPQAADGELLPCPCCKAPCVVEDTEAHRVTLQDENGDYYTESRLGRRTYRYVNRGEAE